MEVDRDLDLRRREVPRLELRCPRLLLRLRVGEVGEVARSELL